MRAIVRVLMITAVIYAIACPSAPSWADTPMVSVTCNKTSIPSDTQSAATITVVVRMDGKPVAGETVTFTVSDPAAAVSPASVVTNPSGFATTTLKSTSMVEGTDGDKQIEVTVTCMDVTKTTSVRLCGLVFKIVTNYDKIYAGNEFYRNSTLIGFSAKDTAGNACQGNVVFTTDLGRYEESTTKALIGGQVFNALLAGDEGSTPGKDTFARVTFGGITKEVKVLHAVKSAIEADLQPSSETPTDQAICNVIIYDQYGEGFPGAKVTFTWKNPAIPTDITSTYVSRTGPSGRNLSVSNIAFVSGYGSVKIKADNIPAKYFVIRHKARKN